MSAITHVTQGKGNWRNPLLLIIVTTLIIVEPIGIAVTNALLLIGWILLQLLSLRRSTRHDDRLVAEDTSTSGSTASEPFVSVHVAIHNEPSHLVCQTLDALAVLEYSAYEVIVIDNNTPDTQVWKPVQEHCDALGSRFRFIHRMNVVGAKAGALNIARQSAAYQSRYIATVDADYQVSPDFLRLAMAAATTRQAAYVQFPQAYRIGSISQLPLVDELTDYFDRHARSTVQDSSMLLTGTLSVISVDALDSVGGWPIQTITEDAELGVKLQSTGARGAFVDRCAGRGLLPPCLSELQQQRRRWITGNLQVLNATVAAQAGSVRLTHVAQLTAWCVFLAIPAGISVILSLASWLLEERPGHWQSAMAISLATILGQVVVFAVLSRARLGYLHVKLALSLSSSWATLLAITGSQQPFRCTARIAESLGMSRHSLAVGVPLVAALIAAVVDGWWVAVSALGVLLIGLHLQLVLDKQLRLQDRHDPLVPPQWSTPNAK